MKKSLLLQSLVCLLSVSCSVQEIETRDTAPTKGDRFYASLESYSEPETRIYVDEDVKILWEYDDRISIFNNNTQNKQFCFDGETGENSGFFEEVTGSGPAGPSEPLGFIYAVYPYLNSTSINKEGVMMLTLPEVQTYRKDSFGPGANTMVSTTDDVLLKFKNVGGYLVLNLFGEGVNVSSIKLEGNNNEIISGKATFTPAVGVLPTIKMEKTEGKSITLNCETPVELKAKKEEATQFWLVVPPVDFTKGFKLTVTDSEGNKFTKSTSANLSITRNEVLRLTPLRVVTVPIKYAKASTLSIGSTYLIVDVDDQRLFMGATNGSYKNVSPENGVITDTNGSMADYEFTVENEGNNYFLKFNDGKYLICNYESNSSSGIVYVDSQSDVTYPYSVTTGANGAFFFSTTKVRPSQDKDQVLYYKEGNGSNNTNIFKIGESGRTIGVHLYMKGGKLDRGLSFDSENMTCFLGNTPDKPVLTGVYTTVTYSSSDESIATVDANGHVTPSKTGTVTITATAPEDDQYNAATASYTLRIKRHKTTPQYVRVTSADQINTSGEYVIVYDDGVSPKVFKPTLNANKDAFTTSNNAVNVTIDDDEIEASDVDGYRILLNNQQDKKFALLVPEADGLVDYYLVVYMSSVFVASTTEAGYRTSFSLTPQGVLTMEGNSSYNFLYSSGSFSAVYKGSSTNLYLFVRNQGPVKQRQYPYFAEGTVTWSLGEGYEIGGSYDPQPVIDAQTTVTYSAEPESVAKVVNGKIKIMGAGTATITATTAKSDNYFTASASYSLRVRNTAGGWVNLGDFNLENAALTAYLNDAIASYSDTDDATNTVMDKYLAGAYASMDRKDCPAPVRITWVDAASSNTVISIFENESLGTPILTQEASVAATSADVYNLIPGRTYYYTVSENDEIWEKGYFTTTGRRRMIKVSDSKGRGYANNCRDLGGLEVMDKGVRKTIEYGHLFRGTNMDKTRQDVEWPILLDFMNVGRDIDLRNGETTGNNFDNEGSYNRYRPLPQTVDYTAPGFMDSNNFQDLTVNEKVYEVVMAFINTVRSGKAVYYHCYSGADRTGYISMLIEGLLGVSEKDCSIDYELTSFCGSVGGRYRTGKPTDYDFRDGIAFLRNLEGDTFQNKIENYLVNTVGIQQAAIDEFKALVLK